jgi:hypothetical protein
LIVDARDFVPPDNGTCARPGCGKPPAELCETRLYCGPKHKERARLARRNGKPYTAVPGFCAVCAVPLPPRPATCCSPECAQYVKGHSAWATFTKETKKPKNADAWRGWLATRLGCLPDHPELEQVALQLAAHGALVAYVNREGRLAGLGEPRK